MDKKAEMAHPFKPGETADRAIPEAPIHMEQAFHVGERAAARRRRLTTAGKVAAAAVLATAGALGLGKITDGLPQSQAAESFDAKQEQVAKNELYKADQFYDGKLNITIHLPNENTKLNLRNAPIIENNTIDWKDVISIDGTNIPPGTNSFSIEDPLIAIGQDPVDKTQSADWISLDIIKRNADGQTEDERAFILNGEQTSTHVKVVESGAIKPLSMSTDNDHIGKVTVVNP